MSCLNPSGQAVDWWVAYKAPKVDGVNGIFEDGLGYSYLDSTSASGGFQIMGGGLRATSGNPIYQTLQQLYSASNGSAAWMMYNDQSPDDKQHSSYAHSKGDAAWTSGGGFWLVHSVPRWPPYQKDGYEFPDNEVTYGQSFLCLSLEASAFDVVGKAWTYNKPYVYDSSLPSWAAAAAPSMQKVMDHEWVAGSATDELDLRTRAGSLFHVFCKTDDWGRDLYEELVAPGLNSDLLVESWMNGALSNQMPSFCPPQYRFAVDNVRSVSLPGGIEFTETKDHSKWAVSQHKTGWVCIGDINRQFSQANRGGGTVCHYDSNLYQAFNSSISSADHC